MYIRMRYLAVIYSQTFYEFFITGDLSLMSHSYTACLIFSAVSSLLVYPMLMYHAYVSSLLLLFYAFVLLLQLNGVLVVVLQPFCKNLLSVKPEFVQICYVTNHLSCTAIL